MSSRAFFLLSGAAFILLATTSCNWLAKRPEPSAPTAGAPELLGRVASTPAGQKFVLIQRYSNHTPAAGTVLTTLGPGNRSANLLTTGESLGQFTAADIRSGTPEVGDAVYLRVPSPRDSPPSPIEPEPQDAHPAPPELVPKNN